MENYRAIAYVTVPASENWRWIGKDGEEPVSGVDTHYITHIHFAFGMIKAYRFEEGKPGCPLKNQDGRTASREAYRDPSDGQYHYRAVLNGWIEEMETVVDGRKYVRALCRLKEEKPELKVLVSIGGWDSDGFCYMASEEDSRREFIQSCLEMIREYSLDGIDLDWEYPTNGAWGEIASCDHCTTHAKQLLKEFRAALEEAFPGEGKVLSIASGMFQPWVDSETFHSLDYMNVMCYDYEPGNGESQADIAYGKDGVMAHAAMVGDTPENRKKINMGVPFYNEGGSFLVPYYKGFDGYVDASREQTAAKMNWVKEQGFGGGFYWAYSMDTFEQDVKEPDSKEIKILQRTLYETLNKK